MGPDTAPPIESHLEDQPVSGTTVGTAFPTHRPVLLGTLTKRGVDLTLLPIRYPGVDPKELIKAHYGSDPLVDDFRRVVTLGLRVWNNVRAKGVVTAPDNIEAIYKLVTNPGARVGLLESSPHNANDPHTELVGAVITLTDKNKFLSGPPPELDIDRHGVRLWINDEARELGPRAKAVNDLLADSIDGLGDGRIGTRVVISVEGHPNAAQLDNAATYTRFGFSRTGITEVVQDFINGQPVNSTLEWMVYPPMNDEALIAIGAEKRLQTERINQIAQRIGEIIPHVPASRGIILHIGSNRGMGYDISTVFPDVVLNVSTNLEPSKKPPESLRNLYHYEVTNGALALPPHQVDSAIISDALRGISARGEGYANFLSRVVKNLNGEGSRVIIRESESEIRREDAESILRTLGLRILSSRLEEQMGADKVKQPCFVICAELVSPGSVTEVRCGERREVKEPAFIKSRVFRNAETKEIITLVGPDGQTIETAPILPNGRCLLAEGSRPHLCNPDAGPRPDRSSPIPFVIEQLAGFSKNGDPEEYTRTMLADVFGLSLEGSRFLPPHPHLTLPMELSELCSSVPIELADQFDRKEVTKRFPGLETPWKLKEVDAVRFLQADTSNARAARALYIHSLQSGRSVGPWFGSLPLASQGARTFNVTAADVAIRPREKAIFEEIDAVPLPSSFYTIKSATYREFDTHQNSVGSADIEYVVPSSKAVVPDGERNFTISSNSILLVPYIVTDDGVYVGLARRHSPAVQMHSETLYGFQSSDYVSMPLFSLPTATITPEDGLGFACGRFKKNFGGADVISATKLGPSYLASSGLSLRLIDTYAVMIDQRSATSPKLSWTEVSDDLRHFRDPTKLQTRRFWVDGPTLTGLFRFSHAAGKM